MALTAYKKTGLTGGTSDDLDGIDGSALVDGDFSFTTDTGVLYYHEAFEDVAPQVEDSPDVIVPDSNPGNWAFILKPVSNKFSPTVETVATSRNLTSADDNKVLECNSASPIVLTATAGVALPVGVIINQVGSGTVTLAASGSTIQSYLSYLEIAGQYSGATLYTISTNVHRLQGALK